MHLITDTLSTLGSRFNVVLDPHDKRIYLSTYGTFKELPVELLCGIEDEAGRKITLPFNSSTEHFPYCEQSITMTSITYRAILPFDNLKLTVVLTAPFYPQDARLSTAPFIYIDVRLEVFKGGYRWREARENPIRKGKIIFQLKSDQLKFSCADNDLVYDFTVAGFSRHGGGASEGEGKIAAVGGNQVRHRLSGPDGRAADNGWALNFDISTNPVCELHLLWNAYTTTPAMSLYNQAVPFKYTEYFPDEKSLLAYARASRVDIMKKCAFFDQLIANWSLGRDYSNMTAFAFHSFLINTWWVLGGRGGDWFSVWEGSCYYHSTIDVEYNDAMIYLTLWPELLGKLLDQWITFKNKGGQTLGKEQGQGTVFLSHDMGSGVVAGKQFYPHHMEVEENCNYLLLLYAYWRQTNDQHQVKKYAQDLARLAEFLLACDLCGNGIPCKGTANTIDDASPAIQFGKHQTYLAFKTASALSVYAEMARFVNNREMAARAEQQVNKIVKTMDGQGWLGDHYAVTLERTTDGLFDPWKKEKLAPGELSGWNAYSIYAANGCLYPFMCGKNLPFNLSRLAQDTAVAAKKTMTDYGSTHSSDNQIFWISQNQWRDFVAAYMGMDMLNNNDRYWEYQWTTNDNHMGTCFYETSYQNNLCFYPRGITALGVVFAAAGLALDRVKKTVRFNPLRSDLNVPLLMFADWKKMRVPWLNAGQIMGKQKTEITERDLLKGLKVGWGSIIERNRIKVKKEKTKR